MSQSVKDTLVTLGIGAAYIGGTIVLCYWMYKAFAKMIGVEVAKALVAAGVVVIA